MGHDITAIKKSDFVQGNESELAYIRIGSWNRHKAHVLYDALESYECDGGVSGNGREKEFSPEQLKIALAKFRYMLGEPQEEILAQMQSTESTAMGKEFLEQVMLALTGTAQDPDEPDDEQIRENNQGVLEFLTKIQTDEPVVIQFF